MAEVHFPGLRLPPEIAPPRDALSHVCDECGERVRSVYREGDQFICVVCEARRAFAREQAVAEQQGDFGAALDSYPGETDDGAI